MEEEVEMEDYNGLNPQTRDVPAPYITPRSVPRKQVDSDGYALPCDISPISGPVAGPSSFPYSGLNRKDVERREKEKKYVSVVQPGQTEDDHEYPDSLS